MPLFKDGSDICILPGRGYSVLLKWLLEEGGEGRGQLECRLLKNASRNLIRPTSFVRSDGLKQLLNTLGEQRNVQWYPGTEIRRVLECYLNPPGKHTLILFAQGFGFWHIICTHLIVPEKGWDTHRLTTKELNVRPRPLNANTGTAVQRWCNTAHDLLNIFRVCYEYS